VRRFYVETRISGHDQISLNPSDSMHAAKALRLKPGTRVLLIDQSGNKYKADLLEVNRKKTVAKITSNYEENNESLLRMAVATGFLKEKKMDHIIRQLTELGVTQWYPFYSDHSVPVIEERKIKNKLERWRKISIESLKQCERNLIPAIHEPMDFESILSCSEHYSTKLVFHEREESSYVVSSSCHINKDVFLVFGPEGGFSEKETGQLKKQGFQYTSLGPRILRAETAIVSGTSIVQHLMGDLV